MNQLFNMILIINTVNWLLKSITLLVGITQVDDSGGRLQSLPAGTSSNVTGFRRKFQDLET